MLTQASPPAMVTSTIEYSHGDTENTVGIQLVVLIGRSLRELRASVVLIRMEPMKTAVVVEACRTPIGRAHAEKGVFRDVRSDDLAVAVVRAIVERSGIDPAAIEDVVLGNTQQQREQGFNVARAVGLMAGLPVEAGGATVNRLCGSSLQALAQASHAIVADAEDVQIVGGLEHMHHIPMDAGIDLNPKLFTRTSKGALMMGITAEFLAQTQGISREEQDQFALASHQKAAAGDRRW